MNTEKAKIINESLWNDIYVVPVESEDAKCNPDYGNGELTYKSTNHDVFQHGNQWYVTLDRDEFGNPLKQVTEEDPQLITFARLKELLAIFGDSMIEKSKLPKLEAVVEETVTVEE